MWYYNGKEFDESLIDGNSGFVYLITNLKTNKKYIGKKVFKFIRKKKVKGKSKRISVESDWKNYYGSNLSLQRDVIELGPENFKREILLLCKTKGCANYFELKYQIINEVLESDGWYNDYIRARIGRSHISNK